MVTMLDVANKAGVSKATVSRVLAGNSYVSKTTQDKVFKAVEETGYRPNLLARNLATNKSNNIGLVVTNTLYNGPYFSELLFQAATVTEQHGRQLLLADGKHNAREERQAIEFLLDLRCDAVIIYPRFLTTRELDEIIEQTSKPIIVVNRRLEKYPERCVFACHEQNTFDAVNYLFSQGHRDIAFIAGAADSPTGISRLEGYRRALRSHHIAWDERRIAHGAWTPQTGYEAGLQLLSREVTFTALVASNDDMAIGAARAFYAAGKRIPEDISLLSFDDIPMAAFFVPPLTTVHVPVGEMIRHTFVKLLELLDDQPAVVVPQFSGQLVVRDSVVPGPYHGG
ncbi:LacI family DNA-binding transcriptional regulator [Erwinia sp. E602]|uniref:LacI family DNA-binding transcriptional regulator n=1 Tax=unclassified Erwinia TaxID=2622719 RepID=UPI0006FA13EA|nr:MULTISPECIES: LacI family DNA-binding transcriptional regulator [unclassified Erwinia]KQN64536.1 transcriptional regulator [Erwinia sp. Leaf53]PLV60861.1 transcriptional regulator [Erwinia sp. B116]QUG74343.1 LacI family DNA-binding transcriptional regulator [Erwinia sp. E602]